MAFATHLYLCGFLLAGSLPILLSQQCQCVVTSEGIIRSEMASALENIAEQIDCLKDQVNDLTSATSCHPCGVGSRLAVSLDMGDPSQQCPSLWIEVFFQIDLALLRTIVTVLELDSLFLEGLTVECVDEQLVMVQPHQMHSSMALV